METRPLQTKNSTREFRSSLDAVCLRPLQSRARSEGDSYTWNCFLFADL
jgi:hypothetical protein